MTFSPSSGHIAFDSTSHGGRHALGPILCVCYTNHALDQFLVGLIEAGIDGIVRVGGSSRCEKLEDYNLRNQEKPNLGRRGFEIRKEILPKLEDSIALVNCSLTGKGKKSVEETLSLLCAFFF